MRESKGFSKTDFQKQTSMQKPNADANVPSENKRQNRKRKENQKAIVRSEKFHLIRASRSRDKVTKNKRIGMDTGSKKNRQSVELRR